MHSLLSSTCTANMEFPDRLLSLQCFTKNLLLLSEQPHLPDELPRTLRARLLGGTWGWTGMIFEGGILLSFQCPSGMFICAQAGRVWRVISLRSHTGPAGRKASCPEWSKLCYSKDKQLLPTQQENEWEVPPVCLGEQGVDRKRHHSGLTPNLRAAQESLNLPGKGRTIGKK